jgi:farnesyl diphosphate synthase
LLYYTIPGGKMNRGLTVVHSLEALKKRPLNEEETHQAHVLGWCVEWLQAFFLISDDIMDASVTRRGQPCYYRSPHPLSHPRDATRATVGNIAINDSFLVESHIYVLLKKYFRHQPYYVDLVDLFHETTYQTELGKM